MSGVDRTTVDAALVQLRTRVDAHAQAAAARQPAALQCRPGCDSCCHVRLSVFAVEAERIANALAELGQRDPAKRERVRAQADDPALEAQCALLLEGHCAVYDDRPLICRAHGLPTLDASGRVSWCDLNYREVAPAPPSVLDLEAVNQPLSMMARLHDGEGRRVELTDLARSD